MLYCYVVSTPNHRKRWCISVHQPSIIQVRYTKNIYKISRSSKDKNRRPYHHTRQKIVCRGGKGGRGGEWLSRDIISAKMIKLGNEGRQINAGYCDFVLWFITPKWEKYKFRFVIPVGILYGHTGHTGWYTGQPVVHSSTFG